jgi:hypothetical protein
MKRYCALLSLLLPFAAAAFGQMQVSSSFSTGPNNSPRGSFTFQSPSFAARPVVGAPYYGEHISEHVQTLANGAHITRTNENLKTWRDSEGRTRTERLALMPGGPQIIQIADPVAGYNYVLDTEKKIVHRGAVPAAPPTARSTRPAAAGSCNCERSTKAAALEPKPVEQRPQFTHESLGTKTIEGIVVEGSRTTTVYPVGSAHNDAPFSVILETWRSPELGLVLLSTNDDPRYGISTTKIVNLNRQEPDPGLFVPPSDYSIVDETGSFTIAWGTE